MIFCRLAQEAIRREWRSQNDGDRQEFVECSDANGVVVFVLRRV
jgi:hypothetical protein